MALTRHFTSIIGHLHVAAEGQIHPKNILTYPNGNSSCFFNINQEPSYYILMKHYNNEHCLFWKPARMNHGPLVCSDFMLILKWPVRSWGKKQCIQLHVSPLLAL